MLQTKIHGLAEEEKIPMARNSLGRERLQLIQTFSSSKIEACKTMKELFSTLGENSKKTTVKPYCPFNIISLKLKVRSVPMSGSADCK